MNGTNREEGIAITREVDFEEETTKRFFVHVRTGSSEYEGTFHSPYPEARLSDVMNRSESYITLKAVTERPSGETYPFIVINVRFIETVKVVKEI